MSDATQTEQTKAALRAAALALREALPAVERKGAAEAIAARPFPMKVAPGTIVAGFSPLKSEINPIPLLRKLSDAGAQLALPAIAGRGHPLIIRAWTFGAPLKAGQWDIREPMPEAAKSRPTFSSCRSPASTAKAIASATAPAITT